MSVGHPPLCSRLIYWKDCFGILYRYSFKFLLEVSRHPPLGLALNFVDICGSQTMWPNYFGDYLTFVDFSEMSHQLLDGFP